MRFLSHGTKKVRLPPKTDVESFTIDSAVSLLWPKSSASRKFSASAKAAQIAEFQKTKGKLRSAGLKPKETKEAAEGNQIKSKRKSVSSKPKETIEAAEEIQIKGKRKSASSKVKETVDNAEEIQVKSKRKSVSSKPEEIMEASEENHVKGKRKCVVVKPPDETTSQVAGENQIIKNQRIRSSTGVKPDRTDGIPTQNSVGGKSASARPDKTELAEENQMIAKMAGTKVMKGKRSATNVDEIAPAPAASEIKGKGKRNKLKRVEAEATEGVDTQTHVRTTAVKDKDVGVGKRGRKTKVQEDETADKEEGPRR
mmetsp:Transcript_24258/g.39846  ORF Transcript_24258/g.39846 Transcript_24258/m.39846 type:complete len:312 (-) Transcript_24258:147-1082(-)